MCQPLKQCISAYELSINILATVISGIPGNSLCELAAASNLFEAAVGGQCDTYELGGLHAWSTSCRVINAAVGWDGVLEQQ